MSDCLCGTEKELDLLPRTEGLPQDEGSMPVSLIRKWQVACVAKTFGTDGYKVDTNDDHDDDTVEVNGMKVQGKKEKNPAFTGTSKHGSGTVWGGTYHVANTTGEGCERGAGCAGDSGNEGIPFVAQV